MQQALDVMKRGMEKEKENNQRAKKEWEQEREAMREVISELRDSMREKYEMLKKMEGKHKVCPGHISCLTFSVSEATFTPLTLMLNSDSTLDQIFLFGCSVYVFNGACCLNSSHS